MTTKSTASFLYGSVISAGLALLPFSTALADTAPGTLTVSANVVAMCHLVGGGATLDFGAYDPAADVHHDVSTDFFVQCTTPTTVSVELGGGNNPADTHRRLSGQGTVLNYQLYQDTARENPFGDGGDIGQPRSVTIAAANTDVAVPVHGRIIKQQAVPTGPYTDSVQISVHF